MLDFEAIFDAYVRGTAKTWGHNRDESLGASEVFGCLRKAWFRKRGAEFGFEPDEDAEGSWGARRRGDLIENHHVVPALEGYLPSPAKLLFGGADQVTLHHGRNSATPDGLIINLSADALAKYGVPDIGVDPETGTGCIVVEIKSIDPRVSLQEEKTLHRGQAQTQMGIIREKTEWRPNFAVLLYFDASFLDDMDIFVIPYDPAEWAAAQARANEAFSADRPQDIMPEGKIDGSCSLCPFKGACASVTIGAMPTKEQKVDAATQDAVYRMVMKRKEIKDQMDQLKVDLEEANWEIKEFLREANTKRVAQKGVFSVSHYSQRGKKSTNTKMLKEAAVQAGIDLSAFESVGDPFDVLRVSLATGSGTEED